MRIPLRALLVDDSEADAQILLWALRRDGYEPEALRVENAAAMRTALTTRTWDLVLCDNSMPQFDAVSALRLMGETGFALPFIIVSGTIGEEQAVAAMKLGAADYLLKDRLARLGSAVAQALEQNRRHHEQHDLAQKLSAETARLNAAQAVAKMGSWDTDLATGTVVWSDETHRIFETDPRTFQPTHSAFLELVHPEDRAKVDQAFRDSFAVREVCTIEHRVRVAEGRSKIVEERWQVFADAQGQPLRAVGTCRDITEQKQTEAALQESETRFRTIFENAGIGIALVEPTDGRILRCNGALAEMLGYRAEELARLTVRDLSEPADYHDDHAHWQRMLRGEISRFQMEKKYLRRDGTLTWGLLTSTLVRDSAGRPLHIIGMLEAIDERKTAERLARESEQRLEFALTAADIGDWNLDLRTNVAHRSLRHDQCFGYAEMAPAWSYEIFLAHIQPEDRDRVNASFHRAMAGQGDYDQEFRTAWPDRSIHWLWTKGRFYFDDAGQPMRVSGIVVDITARKRAEESLLASEQRLSAFFTSAPAGLVLLDDQLRYVQLNETVAQINGVPLKDHLGKTVRDILPEVAPVAEPLLQRVLATGESMLNVELSGETPSQPGVWRHWMESFFPVPGQDGRTNAVGVIFVEVTERKRAEAELRASEEQLHALVDRLTTVREDEAKRIARELHDDLGQQLTALNMDLAELERKLPAATPPQKVQFARMRAGVDHTIEVVQKISSELRLGQLDVLGLPAAIEWHAGEFSRRSAISCAVTRLDEITDLADAPSIALFRILQEALTNIARHAGAQEVEIRLEATAEDVTLLVRDNGRGITEAEMKDRKAIGLLGMRERAQIVGGTVTVAGEAGGGTTVRVRIPRRRAASPPP